MGLCRQGAHGDEFPRRRRPRSRSACLCKSINDDEHESDCERSRVGVITTVCIHSINIFAQRVCDPIYIFLSISYHDTVSI